MAVWEALLWIELGILCSLAFPWARAVLARHLGRGQDADSPPWLVQRLYWVGRITLIYLKLLGASTVVAVVLYMLVPIIVKVPIDSHSQAFLIGFFADAFLAKLFRENPIDRTQLVPDMAPVNHLAQPASDQPIPRG
jgi:hypothetical protein